jgi:tRNA (uracil-5-)-methyltransferase TRM9
LILELFSFELRNSYYNKLVNANTVNRLIQLNDQFYQTFALQFSLTRQRLQPGVHKILNDGFDAHPLPIGQDANILELGCGNGELARTLDQRGHQGRYTGLDFNNELLEQARQSLSKGFQGNFTKANLASPDWDQELAHRPYDLILAFAVLHHLPGKELRRQVLDKVHGLLAEDGFFVHSVWQFLNSPRLRQRIQPCERVGLSTEDVDPDDYLLDWRAGGSGLRYVHHFTEAELKTLAHSTGFQVIETFHSDGEAGILGLYQLWEPLP